MGTLGNNHEAGLRGADERAAELFKEQVRRSRGRGLVTISMDGWTSGSIVSFLFACSGVVEAVGADIRVLLLSSGVASRLGLPTVDGCPVIVGGVPGWVSDQVDAGSAEIVYGPAGLVGLH